MRRIDALWMIGLVAAAIVGWFALASADEPQPPTLPPAEQVSPGGELPGMPDTSPDDQQRPALPQPPSPPTQTPKNAANKPPTANAPNSAQTQKERPAAPEIAAPVAFTGKSKKGWKVVIPGDHSLATPAVVDGKLYIGGGFGSYEFYAFDAKTGKMLWQYRTTDDGPTAAVVDGRYVAFNTESCELEILTTDGKPVWKKWLGDPLMSMPAIADGRLMMAFPNGEDGQHYLACFQVKNGKEIWRKPIAGEIITTSTIDDEQVFLATLDGTMYCFHAKDGKLAWVEKENNVTSAPTLWKGQCWFSRRQEKIATKAGKTVKQQTEQVAVRGLEAKAKVRDLVATTRLADYLDYNKRAAGMMGGMGGAMGGTSKEADQQKKDAGVGFLGGGIGLDENDKPLPAAPHTPKSANGNALAYGGGKGGAKIEQAESNLGQGSVNGVWSYQGSKPLFYAGRLYAAMGDSLLCVDPKTEKVLWKRDFRPEKKKPGIKKPEAKNGANKAPKPEKEEDELLDATLTPPALVNHKVFVGTGCGEVACLAADTGKVLWTETIEGSIVFQPVVAEGRVYVSTESGALYCLETGDPKDDGWLMWGANAAHTGMVRSRK